MNQKDKRINSLSPVIVVAGLIALLAVVLEWMAPIRTFFVLAFLLTAPGGAYVQLLNIKNAVASFALSVALSLVLDTCVALIMLYLHVWSPFWALLALYLVSLMGVLLKVAAGEKV